MTAMNEPLTDMPETLRKTDDIMKNIDFSDGCSDACSGASTVASVDRSCAFGRLREKVAVLDGRNLRPRVPLGIAGLDSALAGGLALGRVHMLRTASPAGYGAVTGFAICLLRQLIAAANAKNLVAGRGASNAGQPIVWCPATPMGGAGMLYGTGLAALGLDPGQLLIVDAPNPARRMAVLEDILRTDGLTAVVAEYDGSQQSSDYWMRLARRAQLAAEASGTTGFLLGGPATATGFETSWTVTTQASPYRAQTDRGAVRSWLPRWDVALNHARAGRPRTCLLEWNPRQNRIYECARDQAMDTSQLNLRIAGRVIAKTASSQGIATATVSGAQSLTG